MELDERIAGCCDRIPEIDCLKVLKVYDSCQIRECIEDQLFDLDFPTGPSSDYKFLRCEFGKAEVEPLPDTMLFTEVDEYFARLKGICAVPVFVVVQRICDKKIFKLPAHPIIDGVEQCDNKVRFPFDVLVYAPAEYLRQGRFEACCESFGECADGFIRFTGRDNILLTIGFFIVIKVCSEVQLKIPTFGFCKAPPPCDELPIKEEFCEMFLNEDLTPFPDFFPPQKEKGCR